MTPNQYDTFWMADFTTPELMQLIRDVLDEIEFREVENKDGKLE